MDQSNRRPGTNGTESDSEIVYFNGIDPETGQYAIPPTKIEDVAKAVLARPGFEAYEELHGDRAVPFAPPFGMSLDNVSQVGWGIVFHEDTPQEIRDALAPLVEHRRAQVAEHAQSLDYKSGEQVRNWYRRHRVSTGNFEPELVPYYLMLVGPPTQIPFEFQYLLGIEYAVGRLAFDSASDYASYARSVVAYETASAVKNSKDIVYWGTCHPADPATNLSAARSHRAPGQRHRRPRRAESQEAGEHTSRLRAQAVQRGRRDQGATSWRRSTSGTPPALVVHRVARALAESGSGQPARAPGCPACARTGRGSAACSPSIT